MASAFPKLAPLLRAGRFDDAVERARGDVERSPGDMRGLLGLAHALLMAGSLAEAEQAATKAVDKAPHEPAGWFLRARIRLVLGQSLAAQQDAREAVARCRQVGSDYYVNPARLIAAAGLVQLGRGDEARVALADVPATTSVHAGRLITKASLLEALAQPAASVGRV